MSVTIVVESPDSLAEYAQVSSTVLVNEIFDDAALRALAAGEVATATRVAPPYRKDYDAYVGNAPADWSMRFDVSQWRVFGAHRDGRRVGGAILVLDDSADLIDGRHDAALLWDLRVAPDVRRTGVGRALLDAVSAAARSAGAVELRVETQNVNVCACRFYKGVGFRLEQIQPHAYAELPTEVKLIWTRRL